MHITDNAACQTFNSCLVRTFSQPMTSLYLPFHDSRLSYPRRIYRRHDKGSGFKMEVSTIAALFGLSLHFHSCRSVARYSVFALVLERRSIPSSICIFETPHLATPRNTLVTASQTRLICLNILLYPCYTGPFVVLTQHSMISIAISGTSSDYIQTAYSSLPTRNYGFYSSRRRSSYTQRGLQLSHIFPSVHLLLRKLDVWLQQRCYSRGFGPSCFRS